MASGRIVAVGADGAEGVPVSLRGQLRVGQCVWTGQWSVVNMMTLETINLPGPREPPWMLGWEDDDDEHSGAFAYTDGEDEPVILDSWSISLRSVGGRVLVKDASGASGSAPVSRWLDEMIGSHIYMEVVVRIGPAMSRIDMTAASFHRARSGCTKWWSLLQLYKGLGLASSKGKPGRWVQKRWDAWMARLESLQCGDHLLKSKQYDPSRAAHGEDRSRVLKFPACSSVALFALLSMMAFSPREAGGFSETIPRAAAHDLLVSLVRFALHGNPVLGILLDANAKLQWPLPPQGVGAIRVGFDDNGDFDRDSFMAALNGSRVAHTWGATLAPVLRARGRRAPRLDVLQISFQSRLLTSSPALAAQLVHFLGLCLERQLGSSRSVDRRGPAPLVEVVMEPEQQQGDYAIDQLLVRYHHAGLAASSAEGLAHVSLATDKSRVWGMGILNTAVVLPTNTSLWAAPQVLVECRAEIGPPGEPPEGPPESHGGPTEFAFSL
jgi:hypothetical protein